MKHLATIAALVATLTMAVPAQAFDVGRMDAANSLPPGYIGAADLPPRSQPRMSGYAPVGADQWNVPAEWSLEGPRPGARGWAHSLPVDADQWNVPLWFTRPPTRR